MEYTKFNFTKIIKIKWRCYHLDHYIAKYTCIRCKGRCYTLRDILEIRNEHNDASDHSGTGAAVANVLTSVFQTTSAEVYKALLGIRSLKRNHFKTEPS